MPKQNTYHEGASQERSCIMRKLRALKKSITDLTAQDALNTMIEFVSARTKRYKKKAGGL